MKINIVANRQMRKLQISWKRLLVEQNWVKFETSETCFGTSGTCNGQGHVGVLWCIFPHIQLHFFPSLLLLNFQLLFTRLTVTKSVPINLTCYDVVQHNWVLGFLKWRNCLSKHVLPHGDRKTAFPTCALSLWSGLRRKNVYAKT